MSRISNILLTLILSLFTCLPAWSQATGIPYSCSFEEDEDLSNWVFNYKTPTAKDQWIVGTAVHSEGKRALYISDNGKRAQYGNQPNVVISYLRYKFPTSSIQQNYDICFDWKCLGDTTNSRLYVMVCPEEMLWNNTPKNEYYLDRIISSTKGLISNDVVNKSEGLGGQTASSFLCGSQQWQNVSLTNEVKVSKSLSQYPFAIVFIWVNNNRDEKVQNTGICIDNLQIASARYQKPTNVSAESVCEDSILLVKWQSAAPLTWEIQYRKVGTDTWRRLDGLTDESYGFERVDGINCSYQLQRVPEATYDIRVRGVSSEGVLTNFVYINQVIVFCPENHCVDYLNFDNPNVTCTYGYNPKKSGGGSPYENVGYIDYGPDAKESRHTHHTDPTETDPRTDDALFTVPRGAVASVRLGNWDIHAEAESITYDILVDSANQGLLIVRYAVVLENPNGHPHDEEPYFRLEVLDEDGEIIDHSCGQAEFSYSDGVNAGWNMTKDNKAAWKDWTTIGVNLQPYDGQHVKVRFITYDCSQSGHYGYAYFTVDCVSAWIETENCGNDARITCNAPDGFTYEWTDENGTVVGHDQTLDVDAGRHTYTCKLSFIEDPSCYFEVSTISAPRFPVPAFNYQWSPRHCKNYVKFIDKSHVMNKYEGYEKHTNEPCQDQIWHFTRFSDGLTTETTNPNAVFTALPEGDTVRVQLTAYIGENNACDSTFDTIIVVPRIIERDSTQYLTLCQDEPYYFNGTWHQAEKSDTMETVTPNFAGCDSTYTLFLTVNPKTPEEFRKDSICSDSLIIIGPDTFKTEGHYSVFMLNRYGCDSIVTTDLWVNQKLDMSIDNDGKFAVCADNGQLDIDYTIMLGQFDTARIVFSPEAKAVGFKDLYITDPTLTTISIPYDPTTLPGHYKAVVEFIQVCCKTTRYNISFDVNYASSVVEQKWNDVLSVLSPKYNGGYSFIAFQWYKNGQPIEGATQSYLYQLLDTTADYYVVLTRADSIAVATCPITPIVRVQKTKFPTLVQTSQQIPAKLQTKSQIRFVTATGMTYYRATHEAGDILITAPAVSGVYVVEIAPTNGDERTAQQMIVQ